MLELQSLTYSYNKKNDLIFNDVNLVIPKDSFVGLLGPNGVGKTTLLKILTNQIKDYSGTVLLNGRNVADINDNIYDYISILTSDMRTPRFLKVFEAIKFSLECYDNYSKRKFDEIVDIFSLEKHLDKKISELSSGLERRVELAQTFANNSQILILDEPCNALDFDSVKDTLKLISSIKDMGKTIIYSTHQFG
ncbi:MAG TPA: ABC transporter ATP-binding protein [Acetivibrio clariflavus]|nr:ABC transporter ATP-binding protein [Acetivibrio clariflavus]HPU40885.1 ABC transporter ATP-binding protein [Acetivibrio clariflavus]